MKKSEFKNLLKETIRELISEGAFTKSLQEAVSKAVDSSVNSSMVSNVSAFDVIREATQNRSTVSTLSPEHRQMLREKMSDGFIERPQVTHSDGPAQIHSHMKNLVKGAAMEISRGNAGQAALMEEIFADTVATTMVNQRGDLGNLSNYIAEESPMSAEQLQQEEQVLNVLAGQGGASRWAAVAGLRKNK